MEYYISNDGNQKGPFTVEELERFKIPANTLVSAPNIEGWVEAWRVIELKNAITTPAPPPTFTQQQETAPACPKTWLTESILVTLLCCLPLGVVSLINSSKVETYYAQKNYRQAQEASDSAKKWLKIGVISMAILLFLYLLIYVVIFGVILSNANIPLY